MHGGAICFHKTFWVSTIRSSVSPLNKTDLITNVVSAVAHFASIWTVKTMHLRPSRKIEVFKSALKILLKSRLLIGGTDSQRHFCCHLVKRDLIEVLIVFVHGWSYKKTEKRCKLAILVPANVAAQLWLVSCFQTPSFWLIWRQCVSVQKRLDLSIFYVLLEQKRIILTRA